MSVEINRLIRNLQEIAAQHSDSDLFVKVYDENGDLTDPEKSSVSFDNDYSDRIMVIGATE